MNNLIEHWISREIGCIRGDYFCNKEMKMISMCNTVYVSLGVFSKIYHIQRLMNNKVRYQTNK